MADTTNALAIAFHDAVMSAVTPTANFTPVTGDYGLANLCDTRLFHRCRTDDLSDVQLTWDLGAAVEFNVFALMGANATLAATRRFRAASDSGFTTDVVQSGTTLEDAFDTSLGSIAVPTPPWGRNLIYVHPSTVSRRYIRWHQSDGAHPDSYQEWAIARIGTAVQLDFHSWVSSPLVTGQKGTQIVQRRHEMALENLTKEEAYDLQSLAIHTLGLRRLLVIPEPLAPETWLADAIWCVLVDSYVRETVPTTGYDSKKYRTALVFEEVSE